MIVECKAPEVEINQHVFDQASRYNNIHKAVYMLISNGMKHYCCLINTMNKQYAFLQDVPDYNEMSPSV